MKKNQEPRPSPINGPAFFSFGFLFILVGLGTELKFFIGPAVVVLLIGVGGIVLERRYEKAHGIEDTLPGKSPEHPEDSPQESEQENT